MVNVDRVKRKLPSLLYDDETSKRENNNVFMQNRYRLQQLKKRRPQKLNTLANELVSVLEKIEREIHADLSVKKSRITKRIASLVLLFPLAYHTFCL
jgi:hypothetical protein